MTAERAWYESRYSGLFTAFGPLDPRPHDPDVVMWAGSLGPSGARHEVIHIGGAGLTDEAARLACVGEAIERFHTAPLPRDHGVEASFDDWPLAESAVDPEHWVLFLPEQYQVAGFPFLPFSGRTRCHWQAFREAATGRALWVPEDLAYLHPRPGGHHAIAAMTSTGLSAGTNPDQVLLRGVQEVIERDAVMGAWWERYPLEEHALRDVLGSFEPGIAERFSRPNLDYRFYRVRSPFSDNVTIVTVSGEDHEGFVFSAGAACRERLEESFLKAMTEAVQGRHYARWVTGTDSEKTPDRLPESFAEHALYYTRHPETLSRTALARARPASPASAAAIEYEGMPQLLDRLGADHPVLFRHATPALALGAAGGFIVLKVLVVGLQPLHGDHRLAHLGGSLWAPRSLSDWASVPPHPFA